MSGKKSQVATKGLRKRARNAAARYLELVGFEILERDWEFPQGRYDIIARDGTALVFVNVACRTSVNKGLAAEITTPAVRERFEKAACWYLKEHPELVDIPVRLDSIAMLVVSDDRALVRHCKNALSS